MAKDFLVETKNPEALDKTLIQIGAVLIGAPNYEKREGYYVMRAIGNADTTIRGDSLV